MFNTLSTILFYNNNNNTNTNNNLFNSNCSKNIDFKSNSFGCVVKIIEIYNFHWYGVKNSMWMLYGREKNVYWSA